ncbi:DEKNAAC101590 [Brettanomyces naardenensis]|uniref:Altered inheritance of mitochondria protein 24, mitochondrial n=1 Tax=Brettanomyces naardenensis TaxID=13370 RepID=A0A448YI77_BRENA|nr:DEKNAAC101590 [Brettanomyces naardenensis]
MSILLSLNSQNANYSIIKTKDTGEQWIVKRDSLIAWSGNHLDISTTSRLSQVAQIKGEGTVAVASPGQISQIDLSEGESILLNPRSIVAYRTEGESFEDAADELSSGAKSLVDMSIPKVRVLSKIRYYYGLAGEWVGGRWNSLRRFVKERTKQPAKEDIATVKDAVVREAAVKEEINGSEKVSPLEHADSTAVKDISASPSSPSASSSTSSSPTPSPAYQTFLKIVCRTGNILKTASFSTGRALKRISISTGIALKKFTLTAANKLSLLIGNIASGSRQNYFIEFKGPKTLLIHNAVNLKSEVLTKEEINKLRI